MPSKLFQYSSITSLLQGNYDGEINYNDFKSKGDFGLGTFDALDGEMIVLDGTFYQMLSDGSVNVVDQSYSSPFLSVCNFQPEITQTLTNKKQGELLAELLVGDSNTKIQAIKIVGEFDVINTRTVKKQTKPFKKIFELDDIQEEVVFKNQKGTLVGFYTPKYLNTLGVEGVHFHFLTKDLKSGGHVLNFELKKGILTKCLIDEVELKFGAASFGQEDIQAEIKKIEGHNE